MKSPFLLLKFFLFFINILITLGVSAQFVTKWKTTDLDKVIEFHVRSGDYDYDVDWGDGSKSMGCKYDISHTYQESGIHTVTVNGIYPSFSFFSSLLVDVTQWGDNKWASLDKTFQLCYFLNISAIDTPHLAGITDLSGMFQECSSLNPLGEAAIAFNSWHTNHIIKMTNMFYQATSFNQNIDGWDVSNVTSMSRMFENALAFNQNLSKWDVSKVWNMSEMFVNASAFNQDIGSWNVSNVTDMSLMFHGASSFNGNINAWDVSSVISMSSMFADATSFNNNIDNWNTGSVRNMADMFNDAEYFNKSIDNWNVSSATDMHGMFSNALSFNQNIGKWDISNVTTMDEMLYACGLSQANYDSLLIGWNNLPNKQSNVSLGATFLRYCAGSSARTNLITNNGWSISGDAPAEGCESLPLTLLDFKAQQSVEYNVLINWATGVENNISSISVEHSSDATTWKTINTQKPKGNNSRYIAYDDIPITGINYYRLLISDLDGSKSYSDIQSVNFSKIFKPTIFPNPTTGLLKVDNVETGDEILLIDLTGRKVFNKKIESTSQTLDIYSISTGTYLISIIRDGKIILREKILKIQ